MRKRGVDVIYKCYLISSGRNTQIPYSFQRSCNTFRAQVETVPEHLAAGYFKKFLQPILFQMKWSDWIKHLFLIIFLSSFFSSWHFQQLKILIHSTLNLMIDNDREEWKPFLSDTLVFNLWFWYWIWIRIKIDKM